MKGVPQAKAERDWCTRANAYTLAKRITSYWEVRGVHITCTLVTNSRSEICDIRSDIAQVIKAKW
jgi:hypothetical protein